MENNTKYKEKSDEESKFLICKKYPTIEKIYQILYNKLLAGVVVPILFSSHDVWMYYFYENDDDKLV